MLNHISHAVKRYAERYGLNLADDDYQKILEKIRIGEAELEKVQKGRRVYRVEWDHKDIRLVVNSSVNVIVTFLPNGKSPKTNRAWSETVVAPYQVWKRKNSIDSFPKEIKITGKYPLGNSWFVENTSSHRSEKMLEETILKNYKFKKVT